MWIFFDINRMPDVYKSTIYTVAADLFLVYSRNKGLSEKYITQSSGPDVNIYHFMKKFRQKFLSFLLSIALIAPFIAPFSAQAVTVNLLSTSTFSNGTAVINLSAPEGLKCDIAVGSQEGLPDYKWAEQVSCNQPLLVENIPSVPVVYVRVFTGDQGSQNFELRTTNNQTQTQQQIYIAPTILTPTKGKTINSNSTVISWTNQNAKYYIVTLGSGTGRVDYGGPLVIPGDKTSVIVPNLPQKNKKVHVRVRAYWEKPNSKLVFRTVNSWFISGNASVPTTTPPVVPPTLPPVVSTTTPITAGNLSAIWAQDGGDKIPQEDVRASQKQNVNNSLWNGSAVSVFGAKNEVVNFNLVLEAAEKTAGPVSVSFDTLTGPNGFAIKGKPATGAGLYDWNGRNIELFYVRYLQIKGLSAFMAGNYDELQLPESWRASDRLWIHRPDHDKHYPDIAAPYELHDNFTINAGRSQSIWADIYIPKNAPAGTYTGNVTVKEKGSVIKTIPVQLTVRNFALPDAPSSKTMLYLGYGDINNRYLGEKYPTSQSLISQSKQVVDRHFMLAHRHKISLVSGDFSEEAWNQDAPRPDYTARLNGQLFTAANGYDGPGVGAGNGVYIIGAYGSWNWKSSNSKSEMWKRTDNWANWFAKNAPTTDYFLHLIDEPTVNDYPQIEQWASWINSNPGPGKNVPSMVTMWPMDAQRETPSLDYVTAGMTLGETDKWQKAVDYYQTTPGKKFMMYNGGRPGNGSFMMDDDGVALRVLPWSQYKKKVDRWFFWESTYYNNYQAGMGETNVFRQAHTFGTNGGADSIRGTSGWNYSNGDGVLFYPGTDKVFSAESYNIPGPIASLRLKHWRRGIQDIDYVAMAAKINPTKTQQIVQQMVPKVLWEVGVDNPEDPTYRNGYVSWSDNPDVWENARKQLADIIEGK